MRLIVGAIKKFCSTGFVLEFYAKKTSHFPEMFCPKTESGRLDWRRGNCLWHKATLWKTNLRSSFFESRMMNKIKKPHKVTKKISNARHFHHTFPLFLHETVCKTMPIAHQIPHPSYRIYSIYWGYSIYPLQNKQLSLLVMNPPHYLCQSRDFHL